MGKHYFIYICVLYLVVRANASILKRNSELSADKEIRNGQCGGTIELDSGTLTYPGEGRFNPGELCIWTIHLRTMDGFRMNFTNLDVEGGNSECENSAVSIYGLSNLLPWGNPESYKFCNENNNGGYHFLTGNIATIIFFSSSSSSENPSSGGFSLHWEGSRFQQVPTLHSSTYTSLPTGAVLYPVEGEYPRNAAMTWLVNGAGPNNASSLIVDIVSINFESCSLSERCLCEALIVYEISNTGALHEVNRFCGGSESGLLTNVSSNFIISFFSDNVDVAGEGFGFQVNWRQHPEPTTTTTTTEPTTTTTTEPTTTTTPAPGPIITTCGGVIEGSSGTIEYSLGQPYERYLRCIWTIRASPPTAQIELTRVTSGFQLSYDYITAFSFNKRGANQTETLGYSTTRDNETIVMTGSVVILQFHTEMFGTGFLLNFRTLGDVQNDIRYGNDSNTGIVPGNIDYPAGNANYRDHELSTFVISTNYRWEQGQFQLTLDSFSLENSSGCVHDGLLIYRVEKNIIQQMAMYCGDSYQPIVHRPTTAVLIFLYSDFNAVRSGFRASWVAVVPP